MKTVTWLLFVAALSHVVHAVAPPYHARGRRIAVISRAPTPTYVAARNAMCRATGATCTDASDMHLTVLQHQLKRAHYLAVLVEGPDSAAIADFAAWSGTPVIRVATSLVDVHAAFERPTLVVARESCAPGRFTPSVRCHVVGGADPQSSLTRAIMDALAYATPPPFTCTPPTLPYNIPADVTSASLGLAMIVRNEGLTINRTLDAAMGSIDGWTVLDTGSEDDTVTQVKNSKLAQAVPGTVSESAFIDFATTRNAALRLHGMKTAYTYMPDAEYWTIGLWRLRMITERLHNECRHWSPFICGAGLQIALRTTGVEFFKTLVYPSFGQGTNAGWHYRYPVHELPGLGESHGGDTIAVPTYVRMEPLPGINSRAKSPARWQNFDLPMLRKACAENPGEPRNAFYLARTLHALNRNEEALDAYARRIKLGGWIQERFFSHYERGRILADMPGRDPRADFLAAFAIDGERVEPLVALSLWHGAQADNCTGNALEKRACRAAHRASAFVYASQATTLADTVPPNKLFLFRDDYEWKSKLELVVQAYWLTEAVGDVVTSGLAAARDQVEKYPERPLFQNNLAFFEKLVGKEQQV